MMRLLFAATLPEGRREQDARSRQAKTQGNDCPTSPGSTRETSYKSRQWFGLGPKRHPEEGRQERRNQEEERIVENKTMASTLSQ